MIIPTQVVLPSEDATKVRKYPICFSDVPPPAPATDIAELTNPSLTTKVSDRNTEVAKLLSYTGFLISEFAKPHHKENEEIMEASIQVEEMAGRLQGLTQMTRNMKRVVRSFGRGGRNYGTSFVLMAV